MENVVLSIHLILALLLIGVVLLQRSEGGGLGMGSSNSSGVGGVMTGRQAANALTRVTWILAAGFFVTSVTLTVLAAQKAREESVLDRGATTPPAASAPATPTPDQNSGSANDSTNSLGVVMPPAPAGSAASTGGSSGESTSGSTAPVTPPPAN